MQPLGRGRVLIVDDDLAIVTALARLLVREHDVVALQSARSALERLHAGERFDVILSDLDMPEMTGPELFREIHQLDPQQHACIVAITGGHPSPELGVPVLQKPLDPEALRYAVRARLLSLPAARAGFAHTG
jgi:CheY-like chemotaxis protein